MVERNHRRPTGRLASARYASHTDKTPRKLARDVGPVVYAIRTKDGLIKIGHTANIYERALGLGGLKSILALRPGTYDDEQAIHRSLIAHRAKAREYYHPAPEVLAVVNEMRAGNRMDPITE